MDGDAFDLICAMMNMKQLLKLKEKNEPVISGKDGKVDMCRAFDEILQDKKDEGIRIGKELGERSGEERMRKLMEMLVRDGRMEEIVAATKSLGACRKLYQEYGV